LWSIELFLKRTQQNQTDPMTQ